MVMVRPLHHARRCDRERERCQVLGCTSHVSAMNHRLAPLATFVFLVGADAEFIWRVGLQVLDHGVSAGAHLIVPLLVAFPVAHGVVATGGENRGAESHFTSGYASPQIAHLVRGRDHPEKHAKLSI